MLKRELSRRTFVKIGAAASATTAVLGVNSGALGGLSEASAADQPVDAGDVQKIRSECRACGKMECATWVWVKNGRVIKITGDETSVASRGNLCSKGRAAIQALYHPDRLKYPMKRTRPKGEDPGWVRISWDEAFELGAKGFNTIREKYGPHAIKIMHGTSRITTYGAMAIQPIFGTANAGCTAGQVCKGPRVASAGIFCFPGAHWQAMNDGVKCFFQWGSNTEVSNYDTAGRVAVEERFKAEKSILIGPRAQNLGKEADLWLPVRPGTDDAIASALLNVIISEKRYDKLFVQRWTNGPFLYAAELEPSGFTWVSPYDMGAYPLNIKTRLIKESDLIEGGSPEKFAVMDQKAGKITYFDSKSGLWEGETFRKPTKTTMVANGVLPEDPGFDPDIDPALEGEFQLVLKDGKTVRAVPAFQLFAARVSEWTPEKAGEHCWVDPEKIVEVARAYGAAPGLGGIEYNLATEHQANSIQTTRGILTLSALMNNLDTPGGNRGGEANYYLYNSFFLYCVPWAKVMGPGMPVEEANKVAGFEKFPLMPWFQTMGGAAHHHDHTTATDMILTGKPYPIRGMLSCTGNHAHSANATKNWEAYKTLDFYWGAELWFSPLIELADVVVPAKHFLELSCLRFSQGASSSLGVQRAIVKPLAEARWDSHAIQSGLCKAMGLPWWPSKKEDAPPFWPDEWLVDWPTEEQMLDSEVLPMIRGFADPSPDGNKLRVKSFEDLAQQYQEHGCWDLKEITPYGYYKRYMWGEMRVGKVPGFPTPTGKFELFSTILESYHPGEELPVVREPLESPYSTPEVYKEYPFILTSGRRIPVYFHNEHRQLPWCREQWPVPRFHINPEDAEKLGIKQGDWCWIESRRGKIRQCADLFEGIHPGVIECDHQWWYPELPAPDHGWQFSNINVLVDEYAQDPIIGSTALRAYLVKVYKATEGAPPGIIESASDPRLKAWLPTYEGRD
ncbi:MAG: molybdopterin dinucleotide binding domain-containing protein [Coriobacteriia bacterium]